MALIFNDTFTEAANTVLSAHTPDTGTSWTMLYADGTEAATGWVVTASTDKTNPRLSADTGSIYTADATYSVANYELQCTMVALDTGTVEPLYLFVRIQDQENMYAVRINDQGGTGTCQLYKKVSGTWTALGSAFDPPANDSVIKLRIVGSTLQFLDDGTVVASATDTAITAAGKAGIGAGGGAELVTSTDNADNTNVIDAFSVNTITAVLTGTLVPTVTETDIVTGGKTLIITLDSDAWIAAGALSFDLQRDEIIAGVDSAQSEATGWDLVPKATQGVAGVVRTSDTVVTITWDAFATYNITATETITVTVPGTALVGAAAILATPTFTVTHVGGGASIRRYSLTLSGVG